MVASQNPKVPFNREPEARSRLHDGLIADLSAPIHRPRKWTRAVEDINEVSLAKGIHLINESGKTADNLQTAYSDFDEFLRSGRLTINGSYPIKISIGTNEMSETFQIKIGDQGARLRAEGPEGVRRALTWIQNEIKSRGGPFLPSGTFRRTPVIETRISRCIYSPINRSPHYRDELADDYDYYPEGYLNRLAHLGVNGIFIVVKFADLCPSKLIPEYGRHAIPRLKKLATIVEKCARYGIRIFPLCTEPASFSSDSAILKKHPELGGHRVGSQVFFCTESKLGAAYLEECGQMLFKTIPELGGLIVISVGEAGSHCYSGSDSDNNCPRCKKLPPWTVMRRAFQHLERGIHSANPHARVISWPYGQFWYWNINSLPTAAAHMPKDVVLMHNFESSGTVTQMGRSRMIWDYSLSYIGPSETFVHCAEAAKANGTAIFAKLQTGCSFETATVPFVPVPGILYEKYRALHNLGATGVLQGWYHGNYPSLMTRAAGELSMAPFSITERDFLTRLARIEWGDNASTAVRAWAWFKKAYLQLPATHLLGWYGPTSAGTTWPLYLEPRNLPLSPSWESGWPPSGDHIGECVPTFSLREVQTLVRRVVRFWEKGVNLLSAMSLTRAELLLKKKDIDVTKALLVLFQSTQNIFEFYGLREQLAYAPPKDRSKLLRMMRRIVRQELAATKRLIRLSLADSRLGFHSEAEAYMFSPDLLKQRLRSLQECLDQEFPRIAKRCESPLALFPKYTGEDPGETFGYATSVRFRSKLQWMEEKNPWEKAEVISSQNWSLYSNQTGAFENLAPEMLEEPCQWAVLYDSSSFYIRVRCPKAMPESLSYSGDFRDYWNHEHLCLKIKTSGIWPEVQFLIHPTGASMAICGIRLRGEITWDYHITRERRTWITFFRIPFASVDLTTRDRVRFNIERKKPIGDGGLLINSWANLHTPSLKSRLTYGNAEPNANLAWLYLRGREARDV